MSEEEKEKMLDLLCDKFVYGLSEQEAEELERLGYDPKEAEAIEMTVAALGFAGLDLESEMPKHLRSGILVGAESYFGFEKPEVRPPLQQELQTGRTGLPWFNWLGWGFAAAASIALAMNLMVPRGDDLRANATPTPTATPQEILDPSNERQKLLAASANTVVLAQWGPGNVKELAGIEGDVVWSDEMQAGYMRFKGLPKNEANSATYQLWIFDETQDPKTPIDGGTFDVTADGEVIVPINAKLKPRNPSAFAVTIEKPGGVVVSEREKIVALAPVKPRQV